MQPILTPPDGRHHFGLSEIRTYDHSHASPELYTVHERRTPISRSFIYISEFMLIGPIWYVELELRRMFKLSGLFFIGFSYFYVVWRKKISICELTTVDTDTAIRKFNQMK